MKKRTGVERAVIVMAVVVVLLAIALIVVNAAGIRIHKSAPETPAATNLPQFPFSDADPWQWTDPVAGRPAGSFRRRRG